jgi:hypothetical protein
MGARTGRRNIPVTLCQRAALSYISVQICPDRLTRRGLLGQTVWVGATDLADSRRTSWNSYKTWFLFKWYPLKGRNYCARELGLSHAQVRAKAYRLQLRINPTCESLLVRHSRQGESIRGRKRPGHSEFMRAHPISEESRRKAGRTMRARSPEENALIGEKALATRIRNGKPWVAARTPRSTWRSGWADIGGKRNFYRSLWEANYARYLEWMKTVGHISDWQHEPETFWFDGIKRGCVSYLPDFSVKRTDGSVEYHEVKGWMDDRSKTKIARMAKYHPNVKLSVVDAKAYRQLVNAVSSLVPGWVFPKRGKR